MEGEWFAHDHEGGDEPHSHRHDPGEAEEHHDAVEDDGTCPVCGDVHELDDEEEKEAEEAEHEGDDGGDDEDVKDEPEEEEDDSPEDEGDAESEEKGTEEPTKVTVPPQAEEPEGTHERKSITTSAFRRRRQH